jgi:hypothetical protein
MLSAPTLSLNQILCKSACARGGKWSVKVIAHTRLANKSASTAILRIFKSSSRAQTLKIRPEIHVTSFYKKYQKSRNIGPTGRFQ